MSLLTFDFQMPGLLSWYSFATWYTSIALSVSSWLHRVVRAQKVAASVPPHLTKLLETFYEFSFQIGSEHVLLVSAH